jgi:hypothetical protein
MIFYFKIEMTTYWINPCKPNLTYKNHDLDHETVITLEKVNKKILKDEVLKKLIKKTESTWINSTNSSDETDVTS